MLIRPFTAPEHARLVIRDGFPGNANPHPVYPLLACEIIRRDLSDVRSLDRSSSWEFRVDASTRLGCRVAQKIFPSSFPVIRADSFIFEQIDRLLPQLF